MSPEDKLSSESSLRDKLNELIKLELIKKNPDNKGYPYYKMTEKGNILFKRWNLHHMIDLIIPNNIEAINNFYSKTVTPHLMKIILSH
jgi:DNA-binding HxlR family transcriptional regulator